MTRQPPEEPNPANVTPAELTDPYARPEVVDPALVENLGDIASAAPSEGTGVTGNLGEISIDPPPGVATPDRLTHARRAPPRSPGERENR